MRDIELLHPDLIPKAKKLIELAKEKGIDIIITQTWRTKEEQDELYAQGRTKPGTKIVTNLVFPYSLHCWGLAFDIAVVINGKAVWDEKYYEPIGVLGESIGLIYGGRWIKFPDRPHYQLPGYEVADLIKKYGTPDRFKKLWVKKEEKNNMPGFEGEVKVQFEGKELKAGILDSTTYIGVREIAELLGLHVGWDNQTKTVVLTKK